MKLKPRPVLSLVLLSILAPVFARHAGNDKSLAARDSSSLQSEGEQPADPGIASPVGTEDAPVDGKDGKPHTGPFVETLAERERKKARESTDKTSPQEQSGSRQSNDGVMDDPNRLGPKDGTRGTEGGMSGKWREKEIHEENVPDAPKEALPLPHSEQEKMNDFREKGSDEDQEGPATLLERPTDLNDRQRGSPVGDPTSDPNQDSIRHASSPPSAANDYPKLPLEDGVIQPLHSLLLSFTMILFSEIGDKTFIVAALMAMRHPRMVVFTAAFAAMIVMTVLSAMLGHVVPTLIPKSVTSYLAAGLFLVFGVKMLLEARKMSPDEGVAEEMKEVEMELEEKEQQQQRGLNRRSSITPHALESGRNMRKSRATATRLPSPPESPSSSSSRDVSPSQRSSWSNAATGINNLLSLLLSPAWVQTFIMTFLGEWGDRSQIATIAMAAGQDYWWVIVGSLGGHFICTGAAVLGGAAVAGKVSMRVVTMGGAIAFLVFGIIYLIEAVY